MAQLRGACAFAVLLLFVHAAQAQPLKWKEGAALPGGERARLAQQLAGEISGFLARVGAPSAAEWSSVMQEFAAIDDLRDTQAVNTRMQQLYAKPAFHHVRLYNTLAAARDALACAASERASVQREMSCWAIAAAYLGEQAQHEEALAVMSKSGRLGYDGGMTRLRWLSQAALWARYAQAINHSITIPFLRASID